MAGGLTAYNIAMWNGSSWSPLGSGIAGAANALGISGNGNLIAGGDFGSAGGVGSNNIAEWNGSSWSPLGSGVSSSGGNWVLAMAISGNGKVYAGGFFSTAGDRPANNIAMWNGTDWAALVEPCTTMSTVVLNTNDSGPGSLRQAIEGTCSGGVISFDPAVFASLQTITLTSGNLVIDEHLTIQGPGANLLSISGNDTSSVFHISRGGVSVTLDGMTIRNGSDSGVINRGTLNVRNSSITGNEGSGISGNGSITVSNSTISNNSGSGINADAGCYFSPYLSVSNTTISGNGGAGIVNYDGLAEITNSTVADNEGGIMSISDCTTSITRLRNSIVAGNTVDGTPTDIFEGGVAAASHNLIGDAASAGGIQNGVDGNIVGVDPLLGPLQDNGGPTFTHALLSGSPAINAGDNCVLILDGCSDGIPALITDQRGSQRSGTVHMLAFEWQNSELLNGAQGISGRVLTPGGLGLRNAVVTLTDSAGNRRTAQTSSLGFYSFDDIPSGASITITAVSRRYRFEALTRTMNESLTNLDLIGIE